MVTALTQCLYGIRNQANPREKFSLSLFQQWRGKDSHSGLYRDVIYLHGHSLETLELH